MKISKNLSIFILGLSFILPLQTLADTDEKIVNVYSWNDFIAPNTLKNFTKETGIKVNYDIVDSSDIMEAKLISGRSGYDVALPSSNPSVPRLIATGALHKLDKSKIPNLKYIDPTLAKIAEGFDPGNNYSVIYQYIVLGLGVNKLKVRELLPNAPLDSLDLVLKPEYAEKLSKCGIVMLDAPLEMISTIAHYYGFDKDTTDEAELQIIEEKLLQIRPYIRYFHSSSYINDLASGDICVAIGFSGDVNQAASRAKELGTKADIQFYIPREGAEISFDLLSIPSDAVHIDNAYAYINYILRPDVMGAISNHIEYPNAIPESRKHMNPELLEEGKVFLTPGDLKKTFTTELLSKMELRKRNRLWTKFLYDQ